MNVIYRKAIKEDIENINVLFIEMIKTINKRMIENYMKPYSELEKGYEDGYLETFFVDEKRVIFVASENDKIVGFICVVVKSDCLYLDDYCVTSNYRGMGIGSKLLSLAEEYAVEHGLYDINLHVQISNYESRHFYEEKRYRVIEQEDDRLLLGRKL